MLLCSLTDSSEHGRCLRPLPGPASMEVHVSTSCCLQCSVPVHAGHRHVHMHSQESQRLDTEITRLSTTARDCGLLMPDGSPDQQARIAALTATLQRVEADNSDTDAKNQLYLLLRERTR